MEIEGTTKVNSGQEFSVELLKVYYSRLFPYDQMFDWLAYGNDASVSSDAPFSNAMDKDFFHRREWSFTIEDDIYIRYQCFKDKAAMTAAIQKRQPHKIDIGAVFSAHPSEHNSIDPTKFKPVERELVFDIDMTDYDCVRTCCSGASICKKCWPFMNMALKVVDKALREDFAYKNILWIYSGRRGVHCWVGDHEARSLSNEARSAVVEYLSLELEGKEDKLKRQVSSPLHPHLKRSYDILEPYFAEVICAENGQNLFGTNNKNNYTKILNTIPDSCVNVREDVYAQWEDPSLDGTDRWDILKQAIESHNENYNDSKDKKRKLVDNKALEVWKYSLVFQYTYPRLDANVSKAQNHLLKSPFCVHPKTGRVCIPIDPMEVDNFDPFTVPTVRSLCAEIDDYDSKNPSKANITIDTNKTSMKKAIEVFNNTFMNGMWRDIKKEWRDNMEKADAMQIDF
jgi:DNA primase small subunit